MMSKLRRDYLAGNPNERYLIRSDINGILYFLEELFENELQ